MRKNNKKGFTLVELVIVIAVIAILAAVLIPTFITVIANANKSAAEQEANALRTQILSVYTGNFDKWCEDYAKAIDADTTVDASAFIISNKDGGSYSVKGDDKTYYMDQTNVENCGKFIDYLSNVSDSTKITITAAAGGKEASISYETTNGYTVTITAREVDVKSK